MSILASASTLVIAEIGVNHDGSVTRALELVEHAAKAGADAVKLQVFSARRLMHSTAAFAHYQTERCDDRNPADMLEKYELRESEIEKIVAAIRGVGLLPLATPFSLDDVEVIGTMGMPAVKIASPDVVNYPLLKKCSELGRPLLVSTGAATMSELAETALWLREWGTEFALLHCVSSYPTPAEEAHLVWIRQLIQRFEVPVGYSDHTTEPIAGALAVAAGARIIEKHLTYDCDARGPDHGASANPSQFTKYVAAIRLAEKMRGSGAKRVLDIEEDVRGVSRQSLVAARDLHTGHELSEADLTTQRPGRGISASQWPQIVGRKIARPVAAGTMLEPGMLAA
jgi:N,N'-diacetyllegionaminate synthase